MIKFVIPRSKSQSFILLSPLRFKLIYHSSRQFFILFRNRAFRSIFQLPDNSTRKPLDHLKINHLSLSSHKTFSRFYSAKKMEVKYIKSMDEYRNAVQASKEKLVVIDGSAEWCGPCKAIFPEYAKLPEKFPNAIFYKFDVDELPELAQELGISAMPTFIYLKGGVKVHEMKGAALKLLVENVEKFL